jgi:hypothetical protein
VREGGLRSWNPVRTATEPIIISIYAPVIDHVQRWPSQSIRRGCQWVRCLAISYSTPLISYSISDKTTDENLTSENWELILNLCDKVQDEGQEGYATWPDLSLPKILVYLSARNVIAAVLKRLAHRNPNVQLYALSLAEALSKNCTIELHREIASRAFTQGLEKIITDRVCSFSFFSIFSLTTVFTQQTTHEKVRRRALGLIAAWTAEFENDSTLGIMGECYASLKAKSEILSFRFWPKLTNIVLIRFQVRTTTRSATTSSRRWGSPPRGGGASASPRNVNSRQRRTECSAIPLIQWSRCIWIRL